MAVQRNIVSSPISCLIPINPIEQDRTRQMAANETKTVQPKMLCFKVHSSQCKELIAIT